MSSRKIEIIDVPIRAITPAEAIAYILAQNEAQAKRKDEKKKLQLQQSKEKVAETGSGLKTEPKKSSRDDQGNNIN